MPSSRRDSEVAWVRGSEALLLVDPCGKPELS